MWVGLEVGAEGIGVRSVVLDVTKARIVVRGYQQKDMLDNIYSPVTKTQPLKVLLSYCCQNGLLIEQMD